MVFKYITAIEPHSAWVLSDCDKELTPSIDRLDNLKTYSFITFK